MQRVTKNELKSLKLLHSKKGRETEGLFLVEGPKMVKEALENREICIEKLLFSAPLEFGPIPTHLPQFHVSPSEMERISTMKTPPSAVAVCRIPSFKTPSGPRILCLDGIQDPGNLGSIIRIADWFGISGIVLSHECADAYNPKTVKSTMGSIFRVSLWYTALEEYLKTTTLPIYGAQLDGQSITNNFIPKDAILLIGSEGNGISKELLPYIHHAISIPRFGHAESLNAAIACGILCAKWNGI
jgi:TrmH family RNA methyltransferase